MRWLLTLALWGLSFVATSSAQASLPDPAPEKAWRPLHDGRTLNGWRQLCGDGGFRVENGAIVGRPGTRFPSSYLATEESFEDFLLEYEFRADADLNGGVQLRSGTRRWRNGVEVVGYQVEIDPSARGWSGGIYEQGLRGWLATLETKEAARRAFRPGEWNRIRVLARGPRMRTWINGVSAADLLDAAASRGFIALQAHDLPAATDGRLRWRHLRIKELSPAKDLVAGPGDLSFWEPMGDGLSVKAAPASLKLRLDDATAGPGFLRARTPLADGAIRIRFRLGRAGLHLVLGARDADWQGGRGGVEIAVEPPLSGALWRADGRREPWRRAPLAAAFAEAGGDHELTVVRSADRLVVRLDGELLHEGEIKLAAGEGRGPVWGLHFPASRRPVLDLYEARFIPLPARRPSK